MNAIKYKGFNIREVKTKKVGKLFLAEIKRNSLFIESLGSSSLSGMKEKIDKHLKKQL